MNENVAIEVDHVSMHFNMASERIETLKEYLIKLLKHQLFFKDFIAVDNVSFKIKRGEVFGIIGTNGSGKSTLLKMISGILTPTVGKITTNGTLAPLIELGAGFDGELTARENIFLNGAILGYGKEFIEEKFNSIVDFAELWDFLDMPIKNYSSGMVARIAFSIATIVKPDILIVDEILAVGDFIFQQKCEARIRQLMSEGTTVVIVSHSINQIESLCDRVLWIEKSKVKMIGNTFEVCNAYRNLQNEKKNIAEKEYQIVAHEKCGLCGKNVDFKDEPKMTYKTEAFCSNCGTSIRVSDMLHAYLKDVYGVENGSVDEYKKLLENIKILTMSNMGALHAFLSQFPNYKSVAGSFAERSSKLSTSQFLKELPYDQDLIIVEELLICIKKPLEFLESINDHLSDNGVLLVTLQMYENDKSELDKKLKNAIYWNGAQIVNKWGENDLLDIFEKAGYQAKKIRGHKWYDSNEIVKFGSQYDKLIKTHPFYFYKFNTWTVIARKKKRNEKK